MKKRYYFAIAILLCMICFIFLLHRNDISSQIERKYNVRLSLIYEAEFNPSGMSAVFNYERVRMYEFKGNICPKYVKTSDFGIDKYRYILESYDFDFDKSCVLKEFGYKEGREYILADDNNIIVYSGV